MSSHNQASAMQCAKEPINQGKLFQFSTSAPAGGEVGYAAGCIWIVSAGASSTFWVNNGDRLAADWNEPTLNS